MKHVVLCVTSVNECYMPGKKIYKFFMSIHNIRSFAMTFSSILQYC